MTQLIGTRIRALREERGLSQEDLSRQLGFNDRQTLSAIENGERRVTAEELLLVVERLGASLDYFTDPFRLVGEGRFSWRQTNVGPQRLSAYERSAGRWIAAYRTLARQIGRAAPLLRRSLGLTKHHSYEDAAAAGERFVSEFELGDVPARSLTDVIERQLGVLVLRVDALEGISGAACRLPELDVVLINRNEVPGRRHFDLAHELFHILTWDTMTPEHVEDAVETSKNRIEQLANSFASAVLMPARSLDRFGDWKGLEGNGLTSKLNATADELLVTASALKWRLVALARLPAAIARGIPDAALRYNGHEGRERNPPPLFSGPFIEVMAEGLKQGHISARRIATLLDVPIDAISELFHQYGIEAPDEW
jgi:XRE family transcriptional regulator, fatty acid utilization regulator